MNVVYECCIYMYLYIMLTINYVVTQTNVIKHVHATLYKKRAAHCSLDWFENGKFYRKPQPISW